MDQKLNTVFPGKSLPRTTPENVGLSSSRVCEFLLRCFERGMRGFMLYRKGYVFAEAHPFPFEAEDKKQVYSVSKSWTATAVGLAVNEGLLKLDDCVVSFFPNEIPDEPSAFLREMTVRHLLTMTSGHAEDSLDVLASNVDNPERAFLAIPIKYKPGSRFVYDNGATYMLSSILASVTGESLLDYLRPRLLEPLGISGISWARSPLGVCGGGWGLYVSTEDMLRFGILYLNQGVFGGKRILSDRWIDEACVYQIDNREENGDHDNDWESGYGYQFWISRFGREHKAYRADGAFKQFIVIVPECQLVFAYTGYNNAGQPVLDMLWRLCGEISEEPLPENKTESRRLKKTAEALAYPTEKNTSTCRCFSAMGDVPELGGTLFADVTPEFVRLTFPEKQRLTLRLGAPTPTVFRYPYQNNDAFPLRPAKAFAAHISSPNVVTLKILDKNSPHSATVTISESDIVQTENDRWL